jgi:4a-hydroxytetrahydrobiopterin dehydratase
MEDANTATHAADDESAAVLKAVGRQIKAWRERAGLRQSELGSAIGYGEEQVSSVERGRRVPKPEFLDKADEVLDAGGIIAAMKRDVAEARYPKKVRDLARLENESVELRAYESHNVHGLLQTEEYARAVPHASARPQRRGGGARSRGTHCPAVPLHEPVRADPQHGSARPHPRPGRLGGVRHAHRAVLIGLGGMEGTDSPLTRQVASDAVGHLGRRYLLGTLRTAVPVDSLDHAAEAVRIAVAACREDAVGHLVADVRSRQAVLTLQCVAAAAVTGRDSELAHRISASLRDVGLRTEPGTGTAEPRSVQLLELAIDALDIAAIRPFWKAVLGYADEAEADGPTDPLVDPLVAGPGDLVSADGCPAAAAQPRPLRPLRPARRGRGQDRGPRQRRAAGSCRRLAPRPSRFSPTLRATRSV